MRFTNRGRAGSLARLAQFALVVIAVVMATDGPVRADVIWQGLPAGVTVKEVRPGVYRFTSPHGSTIINYSEFSLARGEGVIFALPNSNARILNQIADNAPRSLIQGFLRSNGHVYLVNPAGVTFGRGAVVDVAGLYAAAGNMSDADFLAGRDKFSLTGRVAVQDGAVLNGAESIHLLGRLVSNRGVLISDGGVVTMVSGETVILQEQGGRIIVKVDGERITDIDRPSRGSYAASPSGLAQVENHGQIFAGNGRVILGAGDLASLAIRNTGTITAPGGEINLASAGGLIWNDDGTLDTNINGTPAGTVTIQGSYAQLGAGGTIRGETVLVDGRRSLRSLAPLTDIIDLTLRTDGTLRLFAAIDIEGDGFFEGGTIRMRNGGVRSGGAQIYVGTTSLEEDTTFDATVVTFDGDVIGRGLPRLVINADAEFLGAVGFGEGRFGTHRLDALVVNGTTLLAGGFVGTLGDQRYRGAVTLGAHNRVWSEGGGTIQFADRVDGAFLLEVATSGRTRFDGTVGERMALTSLVTDAGGRTILGGDVYAGVVDLDDHVILGGDVAIVGDAIRFGDDVSGRGHDLFLDARDIAIGDGIGARASMLGVGVLETSSRGLVVIEAGRVVAERVVFGSHVEVRHDLHLTGAESVLFARRLDGRSNVRVESDGTVRFGGNVGTGEALRSLRIDSGRALTRANGIVFDGRRVETVRDIVLNQRGKLAPALVATIAGSTDLTLTSQRGDVFMGPNEKLTALGNLTIEARRGRATVGDLNAVDRIVVEARSIAVQTRPGGEVLDSNGDLQPDRGVEMVAGKSIDFNRVPVTLGAGSGPLYATRTGAGLRGALATEAGRAIADLTAGDYTFNPVLDLRVPADDDGLAETFDEELEFNDDVELDPFAVQALQGVGFTIRQLTAPELLATTAGHSTFSDQPPTAVTPVLSGVVLTNRLRRDAVLNVAQRYRAVFAQPSDTGGSADASSSGSGSGSGDTSDPDYVPGGAAPSDDRADEIRQVLAAAWDAYAETGGAPDGFRPYVETSGDHGDAAVILEGLEGLFREIWTMGVTRGELRYSAHGVLGRIRPADMDQTALEMAIGLDRIG